VHRYAQTILQLHAELADGGWPDADRIRLARAYELASELFTGQHRGSGKPFVDHLVGTASILAAHGAPKVATIAGLLHAAYDLGDFGDGRGGPLPERRREVSRIVGDDVEAHVHGYSELRWVDSTIREVAASIATLAPLRRNVLVMRLANEIEDHLDLGIRYCRNAAKRIDRLGARAEATVAIANALGETSLAQELERVYGECRVGDVPAELMGPSGFASLLVPRSCAPRLVPRIRRRLAERN
jgi:(p)ppGpp synthase/HD superfamily hydrolase